ncbi:MAG TPA: hypothetical protein VF169_15040 [Albitalea sp.]|uniref:hypothetical protein n=1 Tax=Piscinibacter sp. TaxID=1903157 RepID=UPI002ED056AC
MLGGWDGQQHESWTGRLADMAAVEAFAATRVSPGEGERLARVALRLRTRRSPIASVTLLDPIEAFPSRWRDVLDLLPVDIQTEAAPIGAGDLGRLQGTCLQAISQAHIPEGSTIEGDGSLIVLRALTREVAEHWLADHCRRNSMQSRLFVCEDQAASVDDTLCVQGLPTCGFDEPSALRPALQALPLALETLWEPVEPARVLEFLMHPIGPFHLTARRMLANAFARQPGIGGREWSKAREQVAQKLGSDVVDQVSYWLESARHARSTGAPLDDVIARVIKLQAALEMRLAGLRERESEAALQLDVKGALGQCSQLMEGLRELRKEGNANVRPRALEQLITHATVDSSNALAVAQVGCMQSASAPAACVVEPADEVIWWMPSRPQLPAPLPWVGEELQALVNAGLRMRDPAAEMAALMAHWTRPILAARQWLYLVLPPEGSEDHPAWQLLKAMCPDLVPQALQAHAAARGQIAAVEAHPLPVPRGRWQLDQDASWRETYPAPTRLQAQSFSSLNVLFSNPAIAVLKDAAGLQPAPTLAVSEGNYLLGKLAHRLLEILFAQEGALRWSKGQVDAWFEPATEDLLQREGLPLLAPGNAMLLQHFRDSARSSISVLLQHLRHARASRVQAERKLQGDIFGLDTSGDTDLLIFLEGGGTAALDLKWSPAVRYRESMEAGDYLQLALYAHMSEQELAAAPVAIGFFSFVDSTLLTFTPNLFDASARVVTSSIKPEQLVRSAVDTWNWRVDQWQAGNVEVIAEGLLPPATDPPAGCLPLRPLGNWWGDFAALFGEPEDA